MLIQNFLLSFENISLISGRHNYWQKVYKMQASALNQMSQFNVIHTKRQYPICPDSSDLIKVMKGAQPPMKTAEDFVPNIPNADVFSRFDARSEFLLVKPNAQFLYLITLSNQIKRYMCSTCYLSFNRFSFSKSWINCLKGSQVQKQ